MARIVDPKLHPPSESEREAGMVRTTKVIPTMNRSAVETLLPPDVSALPCSGRCGHCDLHPCQLHAPI